jgi:hypothetical protein
MPRCMWRQVADPAACCSRCSSWRQVGVQPLAGPCPAHVGGEVLQPRCAVHPAVHIFLAFFLCSPFHIEPLPCHACGRTPTYARTRLHCVAWYICGCAPTLGAYIVCMRPLSMPHSTADGGVFVRWNVWCGLGVCRVVCTAEILGVHQAATGHAALLSTAGVPGMGSASLRWLCWFDTFWDGCCIVRMLQHGSGRMCTRCGCCWGFR